MEMWCAIAVLLVTGVVGVAALQTPKPAPNYTLKSWQNQPDKADHADHKPVHEGSLMACTNIEPKKDGSECLLKYENDGKMYLQFNQTITATSTDEVHLTCVSKDPAEPISCEVAITVLTKSYK